jgi:hypothetical protein
MSVTKWGNFVSDQNKIKHYFKEYVFGFMKTDIKREIVSARLGKPSGNFLCALGLLCYTEAMGFIIKGENSKNYERFNAFFEMMGLKYKRFLKTNPMVYDLYRNKMAHVYFATDCTIFMLKDTNIKKHFNGNAPMGLGVLPNGPSASLISSLFWRFCRNCSYCRIALTISIS